MSHPSRKPQAAPAQTESPQPDSTETAQPVSASPTVQSPTSHQTTTVVTSFFDKAVRAAIVLLLVAGLTAYVMPGDAEMNGELSSAKHGVVDFFANDTFAKCMIAFAALLGAVYLLTRIINGTVAGHRGHQLISPSKASPETIAQDNDNA